MQLLKEIKNYLLDVIFPIECLGCQKPDRWLCRGCLEKIPSTATPSCPVCQTRSDGSVCLACQKKSWLNGLLIAAPYENQLVQQLIHVFKYNFVQDLAGPLAELLIMYLAHFDKKNKPAILQSPNQTILCPVPLHKKRFLERGFNQSELLGQRVNVYFHFGYQPTLLNRTRYTTAQAQLKKKERENNLHGAFTLKRDFNVSGKNVILIDDVATTLTTLNECAKVLKQAGCKEAWGLVIARGS